MIAFELGGEAGARLARELGLPVSPNALLERIRRAPRLGAEQVKVLGVDDWAIKKGHSYGTILVDLERRRVVDLLPDRSAEGLRDWLEKHPGVEVVSRDRFQPYMDAITTATPAALQVADRWHLLKNLTDAVERLLERERISLDEALKLTLPEPPYVPQIMAAYIRFWWKYERPDPEQMWEKISRSGFDARYREAFDYIVGRLRGGLPTRRTRQETLRAKTEARRRMPRLVARLFVRDPDELPDADREYLRVLKDLNQELAAAYELAQGFVRMLRGRHPEMLDGWLKEALGSVSPELTRAARLRRWLARRPRRRPGCLLRRVEQRAGGRPDQPAKAPQAPDVRPGELHGAQTEGAARRLKNLPRMVRRGSYPCVTKISGEPLRVLSDSW
jgi:hypothetical protein